MSIDTAITHNTHHFRILKAIFLLYKIGLRQLALFLLRTPLLELLLKDGGKVFRNFERFDGNTNGSNSLRL